MLSSREGKVGEHIHRLPTSISYSFSRGPVITAQKRRGSRAGVGKGDRQDASREEREREEKDTGRYVFRETTDSSHNLITRTYPTIIQVGPKLCSLRENLLLYVPVLPILYFIGLP